MPDTGTEDESPSVDWKLRTAGSLRGVLRRLEAVTLHAERPVERLAGSARLNPLNHTGPIAVFLFVVLCVTGVYVTMFYQFGFTASYEAVARLEASSFQRLIRAIHRYASVALVVVSLLHGWRTFVQHRFRGARWLAWVTGVWMVAVVWFIGVTGYWLIWDERAQALNEVLTRTVAGTTAGLDFMLDFVVTPIAGTGWPFILILFLVHVLLSIAIGFMLWYHVKRLQKPAWFPPGFWMGLIGVTMLAAAILIPLGMLGPADPSKVPGTFPLDPFYLFLFPAGLRLSPVVMWSGFLVFGLILTVVPWLGAKRQPPPVAIDLDRCTGCTLCVVDCPYSALEMVPSDGPHRQVASLIPNRCVSCGICIGSCSDDALAIDGKPVDELTAAVTEAASSGASPVIVFTCERHLLHGAAGAVAEPDGDTHVIPVPCLGMVHPSRASDAIDAGASEVRMIGCPPADCANRNGNTWLQQRLDRIRVPRLRTRYSDAPIVTDWVSPIDFRSALEHPGDQSIVDPKPTPPRRTLIRLGMLVLGATLLSIALTYLPFTPWSTDDAVISIALHHQGGAILEGFTGEPAVEDGAPSRLVVTVDGDPVLDRTYPQVAVDGTAASLALERIVITPGTHRLAIRLHDRTDASTSTTLLDDTVAVAAGEVLDLTYTDQPVSSSADRGRSLYFDTTIGVNTGCRVCHSLEPGRVLVGPSFDGVATRARTRVAGMSAEDYLHESIVDPDAFVVDGFEPGVMLDNFADTLTDQQIDDLVAFLMTLE